MTKLAQVPEKRAYRRIKDHIKPKKNLLLPKGTCSHNWKMNVDRSLDRLFGKEKK